MSSENPGHQNQPQSPPQAGMETGAIRPEDVKGLTPDQLDDKIRTAIATFNVAFSEFDPKRVREAFKNEEPQVTRETLVTDLTGLEDRLKAKLETTPNTETPEKRKKRLTEFVTGNFPKCPPSGMKAATGECVDYEDQAREFLDPAYQLSNTDVPELKPKVDKIIEDSAADEATAVNDETIAANDKTITTLKSDRKTKTKTRNKNHADIAAGKAEIKREKAKTPILKKAATTAEAKAEDKEAETDLVEADQKIIEENYPEPLKSNNGGSIGALRALREMVKSPKTKEKINSVLATISVLQAAIPGKSEVITRIINQSHLDLSASSPIQIFAGFLADADNSDELTDEEKTKLREVMHGVGNVETSTDVKKAFEQGRGIRTLEDGTTEIIPYDKDHPLDQGNGVVSYPDGDDIVLEAHWGDQQFIFKADKDTPNAQLTRQIANFMVHYEAKFMGLTDVSDQGIFTAQGTDTIDLSEAIAHDKSSVFADTVRRELLGVEGQARFPSEQEREFIRWSFQWFLPPAGPSSDGGARDNDVSRHQEHLGGGGKDGLLFTADGTLKEDQFAKAAQFIRGQYGTGEPDFEALRDHLLDKPDTENSKPDDEDNK